MIKKIKIDNFLGIKKAELHPDFPVIVFVGPNGGGKTSVRDAVSWCLTGQARDIDKAKDFQEFGKDGQEPEVFIEIEQDGELIRLSRKLKDGFKNTVDDSFLPIVLDPMRFVLMSERERAGVLKPLCADASKEVIKQAYREYIGNPAREIQGALKLINIFDSDEYLKAVVEERVIAKRKLAEKKPNPELFNTTEDFPIAEVTQKTKEAKDAVEKADKLSGIFRRKAEIESKLMDLQRDLESLPIKEYDQNKQDAKGTIALKLKLAKAFTDLVQDEKAECEKCCPICKKEWNDDGYINNCNSAYNYIKIHGDSLKRLESEARIAAETTAKRELIKKQMEALRKERDSLPMQELKEPDPDMVGNLRAIIVENEAAISKHNMYMLAIKKWEDEEPKRESYNAIIKECNRIAELLKDGGPVKSYIAENSFSLDMPKALMSAWKCESLKLFNDGRITLFGRNIKLASHSEKYRCAWALGCAFAQIAEYPMVWMDGIDMLTEDLRGNLYHALDSMQDTQVFITMAGLKEFSGDNEVTYICEKGIIL